MTTMLHPRIHEVLTELDRAQQEMHHVLATLPAGHANTAVRPGSWSAAQIIEHLLIVEDGTGRLASTLIKQADGSEETDDTPILPTLVPYFITDATKRPIAAPESVSPKGALSFEESVAAQQIARERVMAAYTKASGRALATVSYPHPFLGMLNGYQWGLFIAQHQQRHMVQLRSVIAGLVS